ncbi:MAG: Uma2 family endonuclease [Synechocystis sp.]
MTTTIQLEPAIALSADQFYTLCRQNPDLKFERSPQGELILMSPTGGETGIHNATLISRFVMWNEVQKLGVVFDSSTCFRLPHGGDRSPDVAWVKKERWQALTPEQRRQFPPLSPDFVLELMSPSDRLGEVQAKMREYQAAGVTLGWLINPGDRQVEIYRYDGSVEVLTAPTTLSGETVLPDFSLSVDWLWDE